MMLSIVFRTKLFAPNNFGYFPINIDKNNNHRLLNSWLLIINQLVMFEWSIFDSHYIIKYPLFIVIHQKNFYVEIFCTVSS